MIGSHGNLSHYADLPRSEGGTLRVDTEFETAQQTRHREGYRLELEIPDEALHRSEALYNRYFKLFDLAPVSYLVISEAGLILEANLSVAALLDTDQDKLVKRPLSQFISPEDQPIYALYHKQFLETGMPQTCELRLVKRKGSQFWARLKVNSLRDTDHTSVYLAVLSDITPQKEAEEALRKSEARYHSIIEDQTELICRYLPDGRLSFTNQAYARYYNKTPQELINTNFIPHIPEPDISTILHRTAEITPQEPTVVLEHRIISPAGEIRWQRWTHRGIYKPTGELIEYQAVGRDITERKQVEEVLRQAYDELEIRVEQRTTALMQANQSLSNEIIERRQLETQLAAIYELGRQLTLTHDKTAIIQQALVTAAHLLELEWVGCGLVNDQATALEFRHTIRHGVVQTDQVELSLPLTKGSPGIGAAVVHTGQAISLPDVNHNPSYVAYPGRPPIMSKLCVPLRIEERVIGVIDAESAVRNRFSATDRQLLQTLADLTATALDNASLYQRLQQRINELVCQNGINQIFSSTVDMDERLNILANQITYMLDSMAAVLVLHDVAAGDLWPAAYGGQPISDFVKGWRLPWGVGITGRVVAQGQPILVADTLQDPRYHTGFEAEFKFPVQSLLAVPLIVKGHTIGAIVAINKHGGPFKPADLHLLSLLAMPAAAIIENTQLYQAERNRYYEVEALRQAALSLTSTIDLDQLLERILIEVQKVVPYDSALIRLVKDDAFEIIAGRGLSNLTGIIGDQMPDQVKSGPISRVLASLEPLIIDDIQTDAFQQTHNFYGAEQTRAWLGVPLVINKRAFGILTLNKHQPRFYTPAHAQLALAYAAQAVIALENARLYRDLQNQIQTVQAAQSQLVQSERMAALGRLMASIAHEINNPLQSIEGFMNLIDEELHGDNRPGKVSRYLEIATSEIDRIVGIVRRMRDFYGPGRKVEDFYLSTQTELQPVEVHISLNSVLQLTNKILQQNKITVKRSWAKNLPVIQASSSQLKQVFLNLTLNAIDAMEKEGGVLQVQTTSAQISDPCGGQLQPAVQIKFIDSGSGMPAETLARLFEPLFSTKTHGTGMGLFTSYQIIRAHHGQITATSKPGEGTAFTILLPVNP